MVLGQILFFSIIFGQVDQIGDWTKWEVVLLVGTHQIIAQIFQAFFFVNISNIPELVRTGKLDSLLVLPIDSQFAVSTKQFSLDSMINALSARPWSSFRSRNCTYRPGPLAVLLYLVALGFGVAIHYSIMLTLAAVSFWIVRAQGLVYGYFNFLNIARYPDVIFPQVFRFVFGWIIPVIIVANIPARLLIKPLGQPGWLMLHLVVAGTIAALGQPRFSGVLRCAIIPAQVREPGRLIREAKAALESLRNRLREKRIALN